MSQRVISEAEPLGKAMGFGVSAEGPDGLDGKAMGFGVSAEGPGPVEWPDAAVLR